MVLVWRGLDVWRAWIPVTACFGNASWHAFRVRVSCPIHVVDFGGVLALLLPASQVGL